MALKLAQLQIQLNEKNKQISKMESTIDTVESEKSNLERKVLPTIVDFRYSKKEKRMKSPWLK